MPHWSRFLTLWFGHTIDALRPSTPWDYRWRLICLQPITWLTYALKYLPWTFSHRYTGIEIPTRGRHTLRAIVFLPPPKPTANDEDRLRPIHIDWHGGAWMGGLAEYDALWCEAVSDRVGAVVVSAQYRCIPKHVYPAAHEDAEDTVAWVLANCRKLWNADPEALTVSGMSAGGNMMFTAGSRARAAVGFCAVTDERLPPPSKPIPPNFPTTDPLWFLQPLYDAYAFPVRATTRTDDRLNPILKHLDQLPRNVLFIVAAIDIVAHEQLAMIERVKAENVEQGDGERGGRRFEAMVFERGFHGWIDLPVKAFREDRKVAYDAGIKFLLDAHQNA